MSPLNLTPVRRVIYGTRLVPVQRVDFSSGIWIAANYISAKPMQTLAACLARRLHVMFGEASGIALGR